MRIFFFLILYSISILPYSGDSLDMPVIRVADKSVSGREFLERYEFTPQEGKSTKRSNSEKLMNFAYTLIAEKLWATEAGVLGLDTSEAMKISTGAFKKMFVRDALYKKIIRGKVEISPDEIKAGMMRSSKKLYVNFLFSEDKEEIFNLHSLLKKGIPFDTILAESPELSEQASPLEIVFGQMDPAIEDSLYKLKRGAFTSPLLTPDGWYIFRLVNKQEQTGILFDPENESYKDAEKIIRLRKEQELYREFYIKFFSGKNAVAKSEMIKKLATAISENAVTRIREDKIDTSKTYQLDAYDVISLREMLGPDVLNTTIAEIAGKEFTVNIFLLQVAFDGLVLQDVNPDAVLKTLSRRMRKFIEDEMISAEGLRLGLDAEPDVTRELASWRDNYLAQALQAKFLDSASVSDEEVRAQYDKIFNEKYSPPQINLFRIYTASRELADTVLKKIAAGTNIEKLFTELKKRLPDLIDGGESGYAMVSDFGPAGDIAYKLDAGEVYGPVKSGSKFLVFKVLGKKSGKVELPERSFEETKEKIRTQLSLTKLKSRMMNYTVSLAVKYGFAIDTGVMGSLHPTGINSFAVRSLGFGGSSTAVPLVAPNFEWVFRYFDQVKKLNP